MADGEPGTPDEGIEADAVRPDPFEDPLAPNATDMPEVGEDDFPAKPLREPSGPDDGAPMPPEAAAAHEGFDRAAEAAHDTLDAGLKTDSGPRRGYADPGRFGRRREPTPPVVFDRLDEPSDDRQVLAIINAPMDVRTFCRILDAIGYGYPRAVVAGNEQGQAVVYAEPSEE